MKISVGHPYIQVEIATETGMLALQSNIAITSKNFDGDILSMVTNRDLAQDCPTFQLTVVYRNDWFEKIGSNDLVVIKIHRPPDAKATIFYGLVDDIRLTTDFSADQPKRAFTITGRGFNKALINFTIGSLAAWTESAWKSRVIPFFSDRTPGKNIQNILNYYINGGVNYTFANGTSLQGLYQFKLQEDFSDFEERLLDPTIFHAYQGGLWEFLKEVKNTPFNELFWEIENNKPTLLFRRTPFSPNLWNALKLLTVQDEDIVSENLGRSDLETYTAYKVSSQYIGGEARDTVLYPYWYPPFYAKYGLTRMETTTKYSVFINQQKGSEDYDIAVRKMTETLFNWNIKNNVMENGTIVVKGSTRYRVGTRLMLASRKMEYYIEAVNHNFTFGSGWTTTLSLTRGLKPENRFTAPWGAGVEMSYNDVQTIFQTEGQNIPNETGDSSKKQEQGLPAETEKKDQAVSNKLDDKMAENILKEARKKIGETDDINYCQRFVSKVYAAAGKINPTPKASARDAFAAFGVSSSRDNIPIGACVYFDTGTYGHVGIYTGNGNMIDAGSQGVRERPISDMGSSYMGWGYNGIPKDS